MLNTIVNFPHSLVEFVGPQQPNGEMAQWGNMPQRGNRAQRGNSPKGKVWVHTRKWPDWGLNPGPPGYILGALTTELYGPEYRVLVSPFMSFHQHSGSQSKTLELSCFSQFANSCLLQNQLSSHFWFHILLASSFHLRSYLCDHHQ